MHRPKSQELLHRHFPSGNGKIAIDLPSMQWLNFYALLTNPHFPRTRQDRHRLTLLIDVPFSLAFDPSGGEFPVNSGRLIGPLPLSGQPAAGAVDSRVGMVAVH